MVISAGVYLKKLKSARYILFVLSFSNNSSLTLSLQLFVTSVLSVDLIYNWVNHARYNASLFRFGTPLRPVIQIVRTTQIAHLLRRHFHELFFTLMSAKYVGLMQAVV